jgi:predicted nucleotidyltransferase
VNAPGGTAVGLIVEDQEREFRDYVLSRVQGLFGSRIHSVSLFGSRARRSARIDSDWDVAVVLKSTMDIGSDFKKLIMVSRSIKQETKLDVHFVAITAEQLAAEGALEANIRRESIPF